MIYADHAATTPLCQSAYEAMIPFLAEQFGNPSSLHQKGAQVRRAIKKAREQVASAIGAKPEQILFTASGSEADSWVLHHAATKPQCHIVTSSIEHHAVLHTCEFLRALGRANVTYVPPDRQGSVGLKEVLPYMSFDASLLSIMTANNEIGTVNSLAELAQCAHRYGALFHTDAVQAIGHMPLSVSELDIDFLSASAHKFNGPKGAGFLYCKCTSQLTPIIGGGQQEFSLRGGTENVAAIVGMGAAIECAIKEMDTYRMHMQRLRHSFLEALTNQLTGWQVVGNAEERLDSIISLLIDGIHGEVLLQRLDLLGICVSTGSACNSRDTVSSHVLTAIGLKENEARSVIRISFGMNNSISDTICVASEIARTVMILRAK